LAHLAAARRRHRKLLGSEDIVRLGDTCGILWQPHRPVVEVGIRGRHRERLGGEDIVRRLLGGRRVLGHHGDHRKPRMAAAATFHALGAADTVSLE
jgi:hypothetical protein